MISLDGQPHFSAVRQLKAKNRCELTKRPLCIAQVIRWNNKTMDQAAEIKLSLTTSTSTTILCTDQLVFVCVESDLELQHRFRSILITEIALNSLNYSTLSAKATRAKKISINKYLIEKHNFLFHKNCQTLKYVALQNELGGNYSISDKFVKFWSGQQDWSLRERDQGGTRSIAVVRNWVVICSEMTTNKWSTHQKESATVQTMVDDTASKSSSCMRQERFLRYIIIHLRAIETLLPFQRCFILTYDYLTNIVI